LRVEAQGQALLADHRTDDQRETGRHPERVIEHQLREAIRDRLEVEGADGIAEASPQHLLQCGNDRRQIGRGAEESQVLKVLGQRDEITVDQVHHRSGECEPIAVADRIHHSEVHVTHVAKLSGATGEGEQVAGMGVGMEITELQQLLQATDHSRADQGSGIEPQGLQLSAVAHLGAIDPGGGENPCGTEHPLHPRYVDRIVLSEQSSEAFGVVGLLAVVDLLEQAATELINDLPQSETEVEGQQRCRQDTQQADQHQIAAQDERKIGALHLHRHPGIALQPCLVHLTETGRRDRFVRKFREQLVGRGAQFLLDPFQRQRVGEGGQVILQPGELLKPVAPHQIGTGGQRLPDLDEAGTQTGERVEDRASQLLLHL